MIAGIVLAAGSSSRLGRPKQLLQFQGEPLLRVTLRRVLASALDEVFVVIGQDATEIASAISDLPVRIVLNPDAAVGQSTSVLAGLAAVTPSHPVAVMFLLGDQPEVDPALIDALIARWHESGGAVVAPQYSDGVGNPVLFDHRVLPEFTALRGDTGARTVVRAHLERGDAMLVPVEAPAPQDVDTEEDYATLLATSPPLSDENLIH